MHRIYDAFPTGDVLGVPKARCMGPFSSVKRWALHKADNVHLIDGPLTRHQNAFCDNEPSSAFDALNIVLLDEISWVCIYCTISGQRRHGDAVLQRDRTDLKRSEKRFEGHLCGDRAVVWVEVIRILLKVIIFSIVLLYLLVAPLVPSRLPYTSMACALQRSGLWLERPSGWARHCTNAYQIGPDFLRNLLPDQQGLLCVYSMFKIARPKPALRKGADNRCLAENYWDVLI